jgi:hypothetical protein
VGEQWTVLEPAIVQHVPVLAKVKAPRFARPLRTAALTSAPLREIRICRRLARAVHAKRARNGHRDSSAAFLFPCIDQDLVVDILAKSKATSP